VTEQRGPIMTVDVLLALLVLLVIYLFYAVIHPERF
jgi:K+-transporting ATPase KdpF subunit